MRTDAARRTRSNPGAKEEIMNQYQHETEKELAAMASSRLEAAAVPTQVLLTPWGAVESASGRFVVDEEAGQLVVEAFRAHGTDLPIDYEHQTLGGDYAAPDGQAPAAGWIKEIEALDGVGLVAHIQWNDPASQRIAAREYRYLSPVAIVRKSDRKLVAIHSAALTNKPAIVGMTPIVNRAAVAGAPATQGDEDDAVAPLEALRGALGLPEEVGVEELLSAAARRLGELEHGARLQNVRRRVREALVSGHLVEAQREWAEQLILRDERLFDEWLRTSPTIVPRGVTRAPTERGENRRGAVEHAARAEYRAHPLLAALTSEEAFVACAVRHAPS
jgi:phage I-like protein